VNSWGRIFRISLWGESHGPAVGVLLDGCPAGLPLTADAFAADLSRRKSGLSGTSARQEGDRPLIKSGMFNDQTTGAPILIEFPNADVDSAPYEKIKDTPRPGHADWTAHEKFHGHNDYRGGGHFSGRLTVGLVAAGVIAKKIIQPARVQAQILEIGGQGEYQAALERAAAGGDSLGGIVECRVAQVPVGLGEPFFDAAESLIAHIVWAIPGIMGLEFGAGFASARMAGSEFNDELVEAAGKTATNHTGGCNGGITNGNELVFRVAIKPTASIARPQKTINLRTGAPEQIRIEGRHDACIALRMPVVLEAATAIVLADLLLLRRAMNHEQ